MFAPMRFIADGPDLPHDLLVARDEGQVIFFCGAGVSRARAGLADFFGLANAVVSGLGVGSQSPARKLLALAQAQEPIAGVGGLLAADRVFALLEREFDVADIRKAVAEALKPPGQTARCGSSRPTSISCSKRAIRTSASTRRPTFQIHADPMTSLESPTCTGA